MCFSKIERHELPQTRGFYESRRVFYHQVTHTLDSRGAVLREKQTHLHRILGEAL